jgi:hypothetical protein
VSGGYKCKWGGDHLKGHFHSLQGHLKSQRPLFKRHKLRGLKVLQNSRVKRFFRIAPWPVNQRLSLRFLRAPGKIRPMAAKMALSYKWVSRTLLSLVTFYLKSYHNIPCLSYCINWES